MRQDVWTKTGVVRPKDGKLRSRTNSKDTQKHTYTCLAVLRAVVPRRV